MFVWDTFRILFDPVEFFLDAQEQPGWKRPYWFALRAILLLSVITPVVNAYGVASNPVSSALAAQMGGALAFERLLRPRLGSSLYAYVFQGLAIVVVAHLLLVIGTVAFHASFRLLGGTGDWLNMWRAMCYGLAPTLVGFLPLLGIFAGMYATLLQFYLAPRVLYRVKEGRALLPVSFVLAAEVNWYLAAPL